MVSSSQPTRLKILKPRLKICAVCKTKLHIKYQQDKKTVYHLDKTCIVTRYAYQCDNKRCRWQTKAIIASRAGLKHHSIGYDLLHHIGTNRINKKLKLVEIQTELIQDYGIRISLKQISNLSDKYLQLITNVPHSTTLNNLRSRGNVILSIDGVRPQKANTTLYLIREEISGKILLAKVIVNSATNHIVPLYEAIKSTQLPVVGIISDKQSSLVLAARKIFPAIPHQYCQYHYLRNISKQFEDADRCLRKEIRKQFRQIYNTSKTVDNNLLNGIVSPQQYEVLMEFYEILKASSRHSPRYPFKPVGIKLYDQVQHLAQALRVMKQIEKFKFLDTIEKHFEKIIEMEKVLYGRCKEQLSLLEQINRRLKVNPNEISKEQAESKLMKFIDHKVVSTELQTWWVEVRKQTKAFLPGLFAYCLQPLLPRTNNAIERYIKELKSDFIRILGRKFIHRFFLRRGEFWVFARELNVGDAEEIIQRLKMSESMDNFAMKHRFNQLAHHFVLERRSVVNCRKQIFRLVKRWYKANQ